jgi:hypothetical protein
LGLSTVTKVINITRFRARFISRCGNQNYADEILRLLLWLLVLSMATRAISVGG